MNYNQPVVYRVQIVCTDRGQHDPVRITTCAWFEDGTQSMSHSYRWYSPPTKAADTESGMSHSSYTFSCPSCERTPAIAPERFRAALDAIRRVGLKELDLSRLPF